MFYLAGQHKDAGLAHDPFKAIVAPRPIGWISAVSRDGAVNLSPYSFFNAFNSRPAIVGFSSEGLKDAVTFAQETGEFVCNFVSLELAQQMNVTSGPFARGDSEFMHAGLTMAASHVVKPPRVKEAHAALECKVLQVIAPTALDGEPVGCHIILGQVVAVHIDDRFVQDGRLSTAAMEPLVRCGYDEYAVVDRVFKLTRPAGGGNFDEKQAR